VGAGQCAGVRPGGSYQEAWLRGVDGGVGS
jgi:hypothetical protein